MGVRRVRRNATHNRYGDRMSEIAVSRRDNGSYLVTVFETYDHNDSSISHAENYIVEKEQVKRLFNETGKVLRE